MKKRFTEEQIVKAVSRLGNGTPAKDLSREIGVSQHTLYNWKKKYKGMGVSEAKRLRELEAEMKILASKHRRFGLPRIFYLLQRMGLVRSKSRAERIYRKLGLQLKNRRRKKMLKVVRVKFEQASSPNEIWSFILLLIGQSRTGNLSV
jgi:putative transposase